MYTALWVWLAAALIFVVLEVFTPGFIFACFVVGSAAAGVVSLFTESYLIQGAVFGVVSLVLIPLTRRFAARITKPAPVATNMDALIGRTALVKNEVSPTGGQIVVEDQIWQARSEATIAVGEKVRITAVAGAKVTVETL
ncbi:MAG: NfeD family protein [candidate division Zixibacteria bacterium]|nr:NfeD family protein [candidate division Zixibacteria bacterium]